MVEIGQVLLAAPRSFCAGVDRAIEIVEILLERHGAPVYVRHQIVHNDHVVRRLERLGAVFVDDEDEIPAGEICVLSAHGVAPAVRENCDHISADSRCASSWRCPHRARIAFSNSGYSAMGVTSEWRRQSSLVKPSSVACIISGALRSMRDAVAALRALEKAVA